MHAGSIRKAFGPFNDLTLILAACPVSGHTAVMSNDFVLCDPTFPSITSYPRRDSSAATSISPAKRLFSYTRAIRLLPRSVDEISLCSNQAERSTKAAILNGKLQPTGERQSRQSRRAR